MPVAPCTEPGVRSSRVGLFANSRIGVQHGSIGGNWPCRDSVIGGRSAPRPVRPRANASRVLLVFRLRRSSHSRSIRTTATPEQGLAHAAQLPELREHHVEGLLGAKVGPLLEDLPCPVEAHRNEESQLASDRLLMPRLERALAEQRQRLPQGRPQLLPARSVAFEQTPLSSHQGALPLGASHPVHGRAQSAAAQAHGAQPGLLPDDAGPGRPVVRVRVIARAAPGVRKSTA